jgi:hypothetical protein
LSRARRVLISLGVAGVSVVVPAAARADVFAVTEAMNGSGNLDIVLLDASTGAALPLPAGINTAADELHPSISADGRRLTFERVDTVAGTRRILAVALPGGVAADIFDATEITSQKPTTPTLLADGSQVLTGAPFVQPTASTTFYADVFASSLAAFPNGPFAHVPVGPAYGFVTGGSTRNPAAGGSLLAIEEEQGPRGELILAQPGSASSLPLSSSTVGYTHPALAATAPRWVVFERRPIAADGSAGAGDIVYRPASTASFASAAPGILPPVVDGGDEGRPALTADGRYLAFTRHGSDKHDRLLLWDSQTQTLVGPTGGIDLGARDPATGAGRLAREQGNVSLYQRLVLTGGKVTAKGVVSATLSERSSLRLIVQRVTGSERVLGKRAPTLELVGQAPLGRFGKGSMHKRWNFKVDGKALPAGRYQVTVALAGAKDALRDLGLPRLIVVR